MTSFSKFGNSTAFFFLFPEKELNDFVVDILTIKSG